MAYQQFQQYPEDQASANADQLAVAGVTRKDTPAATSGTDGDYETLQTSGGMLWVRPRGVQDSGGTDMTDTTNHALKATLVTMPQVIGPVAHDAVDAQAPVKVGVKAKSALNGITLVSSDDVTDCFADLDGVQISRDVCLGDVVQERTTNTDGASTAFASGLAAPGVGVRLWIKSVDICNSSASFCTVDLRDGSAGSVLWTLPVPATSGVVKTFNPPLKLTANTALAFDASAATTTLTISANGFKSKV